VLETQGTVIFMPGTHEPDQFPSLSLEEETRQVVENLQRRTLGEMAGYFNRLIYLASLRDHNTGRYSHYGLECRFSAGAVNDGLRLCHAQVFEQLTALGLQEQTHDLIQFFQSIKAERPRLVEVWGRLRAYEILPPEECHPLARQLFTHNVETILQLLKQTDLWELLSDPHGHPDNLP
jgi:hypothetical protein